jgi:LCP family protein required for cell wall assembly
MKILFKKIKRANKMILTIYSLSVILYIIGYILFTRSLLYLVGIETLIRVILIIGLFLWGLAYFLFGLSTLILKRNKKFTILTIINLLFSIIILFLSIVINNIYNKIDMMSKSDYTLYTTNLIALNETNLTNTSKLGMIQNEDDIEGYVLANSLIKKENLEQEIVYYEDYYTMLDALYNNEVDAIFVSSNYVILFSGEDAYSEIGTITKVLYTYEEKIKNNTTTSTKKLTEPFTFLLMGVDSEIDGINSNAAFNGDTLMLITFNPKTLTATILSIPRDTYVPIACNNNRYNKINSSAAYGTQCVIDTVENLVDIDIDYYAKINFNGVIDLVNALDGIDVEVEAPDYSYYISKYGEGVLCESNSLRDMTDLVCMNTGYQHLSGEQALAYARNRHGFLESDLARNRHQQQIVEALAKKVVNITSLSSFEDILTAIGKNISTNLSTNQILSFYQILKDMITNSLNGDDFITIQKTYLEVYNLPIVVGGLQVSALGYYENSLNVIKDALNVNLGLKEEEMIKTFSYDYNEEYEKTIIGKGITGGTILSTVPNLIGNSVSYAENWADSNSITLEKEFVCTSSTPGLITNQNVASGTFTKNISSLTIYIGKSCEDESNNTDTSINESDDEQDIISTIPGSPSEDSENTED